MGLPLRALEGRIAVVTGGGAGIGAAIALALAEAGVRIKLIGRRLNALELVAAKARSIGSKATCYSADLSSPHNQQEVTQRLKSDLGQVDILIQNAAMFVRGSIEHSDLSDFDKQ